MNITILGTGCAKCRRTVEVVRAAVVQAGVDATIRKVEDVQEIMRFGVMVTPAVAVDGQVRMAGRVPTVDEVVSLLGRAAAERGGG